MPTLRPLTDVARPDAKFFVDTILPALTAAGFGGVVALVLSDGAHAVAHGERAHASNADVVIEGTAADLAALLAGKTELSALDKLKAQKKGVRSTLAVRGKPAALRALVDALAPKHEKRATAREIGAEAGAIKGKKRDRVRTIDGRYIKGMRSGATKERAPPSAPVAASVLGAQTSAPTDRTGFALQNLATFVRAGLERAGGASDDDTMLVIAPGEVRRG